MHPKRASQRATGLPDNQSCGRVLRDEKELQNRQTSRSPRYQGGRPRQLRLAESAPSGCRRRVTAPMFKTGPTTAARAAVQPCPRALGMPYGFRPAAVRLVATPSCSAMIVRGRLADRRSRRNRCSRSHVPSPHVALTALLGLLFNTALYGLIFVLSLYFKSRTGRHSQQASPSCPLSP